jgi:hypothetical protein
MAHGTRHPPCGGCENQQEGSQGSGEVIGALMSSADNIMSQQPKVSNFHCFSLWTN